MEKKAIIVHHIDADGYCAGYWAAMTAIDMHNIDPEKITTISYNYGEYERNPERFEALENVDKNTIVYVVDIMLPESLMEALYEKADRLVWHDHHGTSIERMHNYNPELCNSIDGIRIDGVAASELACLYWQHYNTAQLITAGISNGHIDIAELNHLHSGERFDGYIPDGTFYVSDNDTWSHTNKKSKVFAALMRKVLNGRPVLNWYTLAPYFDSRCYPDEFNKIIYDMAEQVYNVEVRQMKELASKAYEAVLLVPINGLTEVGDVYTALMIDSEKFNSEMFDYIPEELKGKSDLFVKHNIDSEGIHHHTLYKGDSAKAKDIHCGKICTVFGGGGHPGAAGFTSDAEVFDVGALLPKD